MSTITNRVCKRRKWTSLVKIIYHSSNLMLLDLYLTPGGGGEGTSLLEGNVDVPLDGVTFSRLD